MAEDVDNKTDLCEISSWNLPASVENSYREMGVDRLFGWQVDCLGQPAVLSGRNLVLSAPTSAGKSLVAELLLLKRLLQTNKKALMILPYIAVAREKTAHLRALFQDVPLRVGGFMAGCRPPGGLASCDIAVCTIEKANSIINGLIQEDQLDELAAVVIDEVHLIANRNRGYLLELILTKLLFVQKQSNSAVQITAMSAGLSNGDALSRWLDAVSFATDFRPVPLTEYVCVGRSVYRASSCRPAGLGRRQLVASCQLDCASDDEAVVGLLAAETLRAGQSVLVFCPTKAMCEKLATSFAERVPALTQLEPVAIESLLEDLRNTDVGLDSGLASLLVCGVSYHHAGLTMDERSIIEEAFRCSVIRLVVCTSTLSSGVNLPARRVFIKASFSSTGTQAVDVLSYLQMSGRAGRMGIDTAGESYLLCLAKDFSRVQKCLLGDLPQIQSCLTMEMTTSRTGRTSSMSLKRAILEAIANGMVKSMKEVFEFVSCTLLATTLTDSNKSLNESALLAPVDELVSAGLVTETTGSSGERQLEASNLGSAVLAASVSPDDGLAIFADLEQARRSLVLCNELHVVYLVTPLRSHEFWQVDWSNFELMWNQLTVGFRLVGERVGISDGFLNKMSISGGHRPAGLRGRAAELYPRQLAVHCRFYTALALLAMINEEPLVDVAKRFSTTKGSLQSLQQTASQYAAMTSPETSYLGFILVVNYHTRIVFGVQRELVDLIRLEQLQTDTRMARLFYQNGFVSCMLVANASVKRIEAVLRRCQPFCRSSQRQTYSFSTEAKRMISDARRIVENELGMANVVWQDQPQTGQDGHIDTAQLSDTNADVFQSETENLKSTSQPFCATVKTSTAAAADLKKKPAPSQTAFQQRSSKRPTGKRKNAKVATPTSTPTRSRPLTDYFSAVKSSFVRTTKTDDSSRPSPNASASAKKKRARQTGQKETGHSPMTRSTRTRSLRAACSAVVDEASVDLFETSKKAASPTDYSIHDSSNNSKPAAPSPLNVAEDSPEISESDSGRSAKQQMAPLDESLNIESSSSSGRILVGAGTPKLPSRTLRNRIVYADEPKRSQVDKDNKVKSSAVRSFSSAPPAEHSSLDLFETTAETSKSATAATLAVKPKLTEIRQRDRMALSAIDSSLANAIPETDVVPHFVDLCSPFSQKPFSQGGVSGPVRVLVSTQLPQRTKPTTCAVVENRSVSSNTSDVSLFDDNFEAGAQNEPKSEKSVKFADNNAVGVEDDGITDSWLNALADDQQKTGPNADNTEPLSMSFIEELNAIDLPNPLEKCSSKLQPSSSKRSSGRRKLSQAAVDDDSFMAALLELGTPEQKLTQIKSADGVSASTMEALANLEPIASRNADVSPADLVARSKLEEDSSGASTIPVEEDEIEELVVEAAAATTSQSQSQRKLRSQTARPSLDITSFSPYALVQSTPLVATAAENITLPPPVSSSGVSPDQSLFGSKRKVSSSPNLEETPVKTSGERSGFGSCNKRPRDVPIEDTSELASRKLFDDDGKFQPCSDCRQLHLEPSPPASLQNVEQLFTIIEVTRDPDLFERFLCEWSKKQCYSLKFAVVSTANLNSVMAGDRIGPSSSKYGARQPTTAPLIDRTTGVHLAGVAISWSRNKLDSYYVDLCQDSDDRMERVLSVVEEHLRSIDRGCNRLDIQCFNCVRLSRYLLQLAELVGSETRQAILYNRMMGRFSAKSCCSGSIDDCQLLLWQLDAQYGDKTLENVVTEFAPHLTPLIGCATTSCNSSDLWQSSRLRACLESVLVCHVTPMALRRLLNVNPSVWYHYARVELPCMVAMAKMELCGFAVDVTTLQQQKSLLEKELRTLSQRAVVSLGRSVNLNQPSDVARALFQDLKLPPSGDDESQAKPLRRKQRHFSTSKEVLQKLKGRHEFVQIVSDYRICATALDKSLYPIIRLASQGRKTESSHGLCRIRSQCVHLTHTGRMTMHEPNFQNVPKEFELNVGGTPTDGIGRGGAKATFHRLDSASSVGASSSASTGPTRICLRNVFVAATNYCLVGADFSQLELRVFAVMSADQRLMGAFQSGGDVFRQLAADWLHNGQEADVTDSDRQMAKQLCYGILYGIGPKSLAEQLSVSEKDARDSIESFKDRFAGVKEFIANTIRHCQQMSFVSTLATRRRQLPEIANTDSSVRSQAERRAINSCIQGSAADLLKTAIVNIERQLHDNNLSKVRLVLQIHDELIYETPMVCRDRLATIVKTAMESALASSAHLRRSLASHCRQLPFLVKLKSGPTWGQMTEISI